METSDKKSLWIEVAILILAYFAPALLRKGQKTVEDVRDRRTHILTIEALITDPTKRTEYHRCEGKFGEWETKPFDVVVENYWLVFNDRTVMRVSNNIRHLLFSYEAGDVVEVQSIQPFGARFREITDIRPVTTAKAVDVVEIK